jgi:RNA polymerase sigma-70 factor (ECF subfamily)
VEKRDVTLADIRQLDATLDEADVVFEMDEDTFRAFYDRTARPLWAYLSRMSGDRQLADDLLQEAYFRMLRARVAFADEAHRRNYLFKIATNLVRDGRRRQIARPEVLVDHEDTFESISTPASAESGSNREAIAGAMARLKPRERELLWLAYAQGSTHREIGEALGLKTGSIKPLLFRARQRLAGFLRDAGFPGGRDARK